MSPKFRFLVVAALIGVVGLASPGFALEKIAARFTDVDHDSPWSRATTPCTVQYYNTCQGWIWLLGAWQPGDQMGTWFSSCCPGGYGTHQLIDAFVYVDVAPPSGYGFTGTFDVWQADGQHCPTGAALHSEPFLPVPGWNLLDWSANPIDVSGTDFVLTWTLPNTPGIESVLVTGGDHPGPTINPPTPAACGTCFPPTRTVHSGLFADATQSLCPPLAVSDNTCDIEYLWAADLICDNSTAVTGESWGKIKSLYE